MQLARKITCLMLSAIVLFTTTGFTVTKFYCGTQLRSVHVLTQPDYCCSNANTTKGRCHTEIQYFQMDYDGTSPSVDQKVNSDFTFVCTQYVTQELFFNSIDKHANDYLNYKPPLIQRDIPILIQSFLI